MAVKDYCDLPHGRKLFFNTARILRWTRWCSNKHNQHPELYAYEQELKERKRRARKRLFFSKALKLFS